MFLLVERAAPAVRSDDCFKIPKGKSSRPTLEHCKSSGKRDILLSSVKDLLYILRQV